MRKIYITVAAMLLAVSALAQQSTPYRGTLMFSNGSAREVNDSLKVGFDVAIDRAAVRSDRAMHLTPILGNPGQSIVLPDVMIQGRRRYKSERRSTTLMGKKRRAQQTQPATYYRVDKKTDETFTYAWSAPYEPWMDDAGLALYQELISPGNRRELVFVSLSDRVEIAPRTPYQVLPELNFYVPAPEQKSRRKQGQAFLDFQVGKSVILPAYRNNPAELAKISDAFGEIQNNPDVKISGLFIEGYASPEGRYESNDRLARDRSFALKNYIVSNFRLPLSEDNIQVSWVAEDWEGLVQLINAGDIARKDEILRIIETTPIFDGREKSLMQLSGGVPYRAMLKDMFPQLRRVEYQIDYTVKDYSADETKALIGNNDVALLSHREMFLAAQTYDPASAEYRTILIDLIPRQYPDSATAAVNAAAVLIANGETATAKRYLEKYEADPQAWNNMGVIYMMEGDLDRAETIFKKARSQGVAEATHNLEEVAKKREDNIRMERYKNR